MWHEKHDLSPCFTPSVTTPDFPIIRFADITVVVGLVSNDERIWREWLTWQTGARKTQLPEDVIKTKDLILQEEAKNKIKIKINPRLLMERADFITLTHHEELSLSASLPSQLPGGPQTASTRTTDSLLPSGRCWLPQGQNRKYEEFLSESHVGPQWVIYNL